ncbi:hypothetical protein VPH35_051091 [Triticum aestivum]
MLCSHVLRVMEILHVEGIPSKHILKRWTKDARDILPKDVVQYQRDNSVNMSLTCRHSTLYLRAMEVVRLGDSSAEAFDHILDGFEALLVSGAPFGKRRDGMGFVDRMGELAPGTLPGNGEIPYVGGECVDKCISAGNSGSVNALLGFIAPEKKRGVSRPTNSRENAPYECLSKRTRFCSI